MDYDDVGAKNFSKTFKKARSEAASPESSLVFFNKNIY